MQWTINHINNIRLKINEISGPLVIIELQMRLLAESNKAFNDEVYRQIKSSKDSKNKNRNEYWNCDLAVLCNSIILVFNDKLTLDEKEVIKFFNKPRNKMLHGDFVGLIIQYNLPPEGQEILSSGKRNILKSANIKEAIMTFDRNEGIKMLKGICTKMDSVLDKLLKIV